jgi:pimeloyl-ACP methyl ester carboxylesterase
VPSRPGYGRTPLSTGASVIGFAEVTRALCEHLAITEVAAVVGTSGGGPTAVAMAARHPDLVERLILQCAVGPLPWPDRRTRLGAQVMFAPVVEGVTWRAIGAFMRLAPAASLRMWLGGLSTLPAGQAAAALRPEDRATLVALFRRMRSGRGFRNDLRPAPDTTAELGQPTLVIASRNDGGVPFSHAEALATAIRHAELIESQSASHFVWFGPDWSAIAEKIHAFVASDPPGPAN